MSASVARKRAERGAKLLDEKVPGWVLHINLDKLNLSSACDCVLGQLAQDIIPRRKWYKVWVRTGGVLPIYGDAREHLRLTSHEATQHGFTFGANASYVELNNAWATLIRRRQSHPQINPIITKPKVTA